MPKVSKKFTVFLFTFLFLIGFAAFAQKGDTVKLSTIGSDSSKPFVKTKPAHSPGKAAIFSAVLPGLGQAYNHKYWKIPIIYVCLGTITYFIITNGQQFNTFQAAAVYAQNNGGVDPNYANYSEANLVSARDYYHRFRDLSIIGGVLIYVLNIVDAEVDAQLFSFNVNDDLSMRISPSINSYATTYGIGIAPSLSLRLSIK